MNGITPGNKIKAACVDKAGFWMVKNRKLESKVHVLAEVIMGDIAMHPTRLIVQTFLGERSRK